MKILRWALGSILLLGAIALLVHTPLAQDRKYVLVLLGTAFLALYRVLRGPTAADRSVASDILGIVVINVCGILALVTHKSWYMDIGIAWALQSFIGVLALAKYLEGRNFDD